MSRDVVNIRNVRTHPFYRERDKNKVQCEVCNEWYSRRRIDGHRATHTIHDWIIENHDQDEQHQENNELNNDEDSEWTDIDDDDDDVNSEDETLSEDIDQFRGHRPNLLPEGEDDIQFMDLNGEEDDGSSSTNNRDDDNVRLILEFTKLHLLHMLQLQGKHGLSNTGFLAFWSTVLSLISKLLAVVNPAIKRRLFDPEPPLLPKSLRKVRQFVGLGQDTTVIYVMCPKCDARYTKRQAVKVLANGEKVSRTCTYVRNAQHRMRRLRRQCGEPLMKVCTSKNGSTYLTPRKTYAYHSVTETIKNKIQQYPDFLESCEHWRVKYDPDYSQDRTLADVYDGRVWKHFQKIDGEDFLAAPDNLALMLNVDWFQPFKRSVYSVGAIYLVVMNLPRQERFKMENVIIVGVIDGPKEPKLHINSYLVPLVNDLIDLWEGVLMDDATSPLGQRFVRAALLCLSADIPACRKCGGFPGHGALKGCSKCFRSFPRFRGTLKADYSDFESPLPPRDGKSHKRLAKATLNCTTLGHKHRMEMREGVRWSVLNNLPYFDPVKFHIIDPMHNLLLGQAAHVVKVWKDLGVINDTNAAQIQEIMDSLIVPTDIGRLPRKIETKFSKMTADEMKNWTMVYSIFSLLNVIPTADLALWRLFEKATRILCSRSITPREASSATQLLKMHCVEFRDRYGAVNCTPNQHMHLHLEDCVLDYGPVYGFWLFPFERYNGLFEKYHTNSKDVAIQLLRKFRQNQQVLGLLHGQNFEEIFDPKFVSLPAVNDARGTANATIQFDQAHWNNHKLLSLADDHPLEFFTDSGFIHMDGQGKPIIMSADEREQLTTMCQFLVPNLRRISYHLVLFTRCKIGGRPLGPQRHPRDRSCCVNGKWAFVMDDGRPNISLDAPLRPCIVDKLFSVGIYFEGQKKELLVAHVHWMADSAHKDFYGNSSPITVWAPHFLPESPASYMPLGRIHERCAYTTHTSLPGVRGSVKAVVCLPL